MESEVVNIIAWGHIFNLQRNLYTRDPPLQAAESSSISPPCMSCGRDDLPERLHTHLSTNNQSEDLSNTSNGENVPKDDRLTPTDEGKTFENRTWMELYLKI